MENEQNRVLMKVVCNVSDYRELVVRSCFMLLAPFILSLVIMFALVLSDTDKYFIAPIMLNVNFIGLIVYLFFDPSEKEEVILTNNSIESGSQGIIKFKEISTQRWMYENDYTHSGPAFKVRLNSAKSVHYIVGPWSEGRNRDNFHKFHENLLLRLKEYEELNC
jgi:hypothetical protein